MAISSHAIANKFIELAKNKGKCLTNMQLQKLVFLSQGYTLALLDHPLYYDPTYAWQWGPVVPKLYKSLQKYGSDHVTDFLDSEDTLIESQESQIVETVLEGYGHFSGSQLSNLTHKPNTPWSVTWESNQFGIIPKELIAKHYRKVIESS